MSDLTKLHPEVTTIAEDQKRIDPSVKDYSMNLIKNFKQVDSNLRNFASTFSSLENFDASALGKLKQIPSWTYTPSQYESTINYLERIQNNFPVPDILQGKIHQGLYLDLRSEWDNAKFKQQLKQFATQVEKQPKPKKVNFDISKIGKIPLKLIHSSASNEFYDPYLKGKVNKVWTFDISQTYGLSIKDVIALQMINDALQSGALNEDKIIVEGTSGNTGAGLAIFAAYFGLKTILVIPDKQSQEKINRLRSLGANVVVTPTQVDAIDPKSYYSTRDYLAQVSDGWRTGQYDNLSNRKAHFEVTGPEIWRQTKGEVTAVIATAGTCGTISGIGKYLKNQNPNIKIIAVDTIGSILYLLHQGYKIEEVEKYAKGYMLQGFGEDIHPQNLDISVIDHFIRVGDATGMAMTRLVPALGFIGGQSTGAAYSGFVQAINPDKTGTGVQRIANNDNVVIIFPDTGIPYRKDVYNDKWLKNQGITVCC